MPATWVAWNEPLLLGSKGVVAYSQWGEGGAKVRWTITFGVVSFVRPFGKPGGYAKPAASKKGWLASSPSSMIADLHPVARRWRGSAPQSLSAPIVCGPRLQRGAGGDARHGDAERPVVDARPDLGDARDVRQAAHLGAREDEREAVCDQAVAPADLNAGDRGAEVALGGRLRRRELAGVGRMAGRRGRAAEGGQARRFQRDDDLRHRHGLCRQPAARHEDGGRCRRREDDEASQSADERT